MLRIYLLAWEHSECGDGTRIMFERSTRRRFVMEHVRKAGIVRGSTTVTVYTTFWKDAPDIPLKSLRAVATSYLDGNYSTMSVDFRN